MKPDRPGGRKRHLSLVPDLADSDRPRADLDDADLQDADDREVADALPGRSTVVLLGQEGAETAHEAVTASDGHLGLAEPKQDEEQEEDEEEDTALRCLRCGAPRTAVGDSTSRSAGTTWEEALRAAADGKRVRGVRLSIRVLTCTCGWD